MSACIEMPWEATPILGKGSDHSISGSSGFLDVVESFGDRVLVPVLVVPVILFRAFSGLMSSLVATET